MDLPMAGADVTRESSQIRRPGRWAGGLAAVRSLGLSRLGRRISAAVIVSILVIEFVILIPSYLRFEREQIAHLVESAETALVSAYAQHADAPPAQLLEVGEAIVQSTIIAGGTLYDQAGQTIGTFGDAPMLQPEDYRPNPSISETADGARYEHIWLPVDTGLPFMAVLCIDADGVAAEANSYLWRVLILVLVVTAFVTLSTLLIVSRLVLRPVLELSAGLMAARRDTKNAEQYVPAYSGSDEVGDMVRSLGELLQVVSETSRRDLDASDQRFRDFADAASDFFWEMDDQLRFSYFSERFAEVAGVAPDALLGRTREETGIPGLDPEAFAAHLDDLRARRPFRNFVHPRVRPDGRRVYLSISGKPNFTADGRFLGYRGSGTDITERIEAEEVLRAASERAEGANRAKSEFLALMSHELRTPLNAILGFSEMIAMETFGPIENDRYVDYTKDIYQSAHHLLGLINDILDLSKIESGRHELAEDDVSVPAIVEEALRFVSKAAEAKGIVLHTHVADDCPEIRGDTTALVRVLMNLLSNAVKFTPEGGRVTIAAGVEGATVFLRVADTGVGIPVADLKRVFEPFQQVENGYQRRHEGTGLGLSIVRSLIQGHGGTVTILSEVGVGTTVDIRLPMDRAVSRLSAARTAN
jgi:PAS domain S-box-containing protein